MSKLNKIHAMVRSIRRNEFTQPLTNGNTLDDLYIEINHLKEKSDQKKERLERTIEYIINCIKGKSFELVPLSEKNDEIDIICVAFNIYIDEIMVTTSKKENAKKK